MSVIQYQPWHLVNRLQRNIERTLSREFGAREFAANTRADALDAAASQSEQQAIDWAPAVDVRETKDGFVLTADVPGVNPKDIEVTMEKGLLTIRGARVQDSAPENTIEQAGYRRTERVNGRFLRRFKLPESAQADAITAKTNYGVLTLTIPKRAEVQARRIEIQAA